MTSVLCPKCGSNQISANKKGYSGKKALGGTFLFGGIGLLGGTHGSNKIEITCLSCNNKFKPGEGASSQKDFVKKKKNNFNLNVGCIGIIVLLVVIGLIVEKCESKEEKDTMNSQIEELLNP
ncbi:MAG: hypothetical protein H6589_08740 [Flavobacteriales bacterium]|nr:hypothetical protein [Flavobacteriales bacterium]